MQTKFVNCDSSAQTFEPPGYLIMVLIKFGGFYEHQLPKPWSRDSEHKLFQNALDQVELSDRVGYEDGSFTH